VDWLAGNYVTALFVGLVILVVVDGLKVIIEVLFRVHPRSYTSDHAKVTALIPCHNSSDIIESTLRELHRILPKENIIVIDDASIDDTSQKAKSLGVQVYRFDRNKGKVAAINYGIHRVKTPYVLIMDDDTRLETRRLPTSLIDNGFTAVATRNCWSLSLTR